MSDGAVRCWGSNQVGALGVMEGMMSPSPAWTTMPLLSDVSALQVVAGEDHTCVRTSSGAVSCWGYDGVSHHSSATWASEGAPFMTFADLAAVEITAGGGHSCARNSGGQVFCWGLNRYGELGDGTTTDNLSPSVVPGLSAVEISAGGGHTCARKSDGTVVCWGDNLSGQLGGSTFVSQSLPVVVDGLTGVVEIAAGERHTCARKSDGTVACWGANEAGQLGDGSTVDRGTPAAVSGLTGAVEITAGAQHNCARLKDGKVVCWGANDSGQLGNGTTIASSSPVEVLLAGRGDAGAAGVGSDARDGFGTVITLDRICYGTCVSYSILIDGNGRVTYVGRQLVKLVGTASSQIPVSDVQELVGEMEQADYFNLTVPWPCAQGYSPGASIVTTSLTIAGASQIVYDDHGNACAPAVLGSIEDRIDAVTNSAQWVKCDTPDGSCTATGGGGAGGGTGASSGAGGGSGTSGATGPGGLTGGMGGSGGVGGGRVVAGSSGVADSGGVTDKGGTVGTGGAGLCGNGRLDLGEQCDDGNSISGDGCSSDCKIECDWMCGRLGCPPCGGPQSVCGNGVLDPGEQCDDGNILNGDGCSASCQVEPTWLCPTPGRPCGPS
jgi:cysteine-rich repeat protein